MKMLKRTLALMLALIMMFSAVPFNAYATESTDQPSTPTEAPVDAPEAPSEDEVVPEDEEVPEVDDEPIVTYTTRASSSNVEYKYNVVHLDAGRKYFSVDNIKAIIDNIYAAGFNQLNLYLSDNQGFRFALDDMTLTTDYGTYDLTPALGDGYSSSDNKAPDGTGMYLTQSEMDTIIAYAHSKGIDIVPAINVPGHMGAILEEFPSFCYKKGSSTSKSSIDLANGEAVAFALALTEKYASYFASKGCKYYCVGADEYANDLSSMGFEGMGSTLYTKFVQFLNDAADIVIDLGMTPRAFNDGFYYKDYSISTEPNKAYQVYYWSSGWSGYDVATAATISAKGHQMINTNGSYYWILGGTKCTESTAKQFSTTYFQNSTVSDPAGSMFCIWCDVGDDDSSENVITATAPVIAAFGSVLPEVEALVSGVVTPDPEPDVPVEPEKPETVTKTDEATQVAVTAPGLETVEVKENAAVVTEEKITKTYSITLNGGAYTEAATVKIPYDTAFDGCNVFTGKVGEDTFPVTKDGDFFLCEVPHFSDLKIEGRAVAEDAVVPGSGTASSYVLDKDGLDVDAQYLIVSNGNALTNNKGSLAVTVNGDNATPSGDAANALWTYTTWRSYGATRYGLHNNNKYISITYDYENYEYVFNISSQSGLTISDNNDGTYTLGTNNRAYLAYTNSAWGVQSSSQNLSFYKYTPGTQTFKVNAALQESRIAEYTVESDGYTDDSWNAYQAALTAAQAKLTEVKGATYNSESTASTALNDLIAAVDALETAKNNLVKARTITVNYVDEDDKVVGTAQLSVVDAATCELPGTVVFNGVTYAVTNTTLTLTTATIYEAAVKEIPFDPATVTPLVIETWITNKALNTEGTVADTSTNSENKDYTYYYLSVSAGAAGIYSETGVAISDLVDAEYTSSEDVTYKYWRSRYLTTTKQDNASGNNQTTKGGSVVRIRYWTNTDGVKEWQYQNDAGTWSSAASVTTGAVPQIVAYYLQKSEITQEVTTYVVDFGEPYGNYYNGDLNNGSYTYVLMDYAIKFESGERTPNAFPISEVTQKFHCNPTTNDIANGHVIRDPDTSIYYRNLWAVSVEATDEYEIYMVTMTATSDNARTYLSSGANSEKTGQTDFYEGKERVVWVDDEANLGDFADAANEGSDLRYTSISGDVTYHVGGTPVIPEVEIYTRHGMLITYYVRAKATEDALTVHYVDDTEKLEFYHYNIAVTEGTTFNAGIALNTSNPNSALQNGTVTNYHGKTQTVSADLKTLSQVGAQYLYTEYNCVRVERSADGKDVYLYYTFDSTVSFVADFGLPMTITAADLSKKLKGVTIEDMLFTGVANTKFGKLTDNGTTVTYTPNKILTGLDYFTLIVKTETDVGGILDEAANQIAFRVYVVPATTVYYEEGFLLNNASGWETTTATINNQSTVVLGETGTNNYGYDDAYATKGTDTGYITGGAGASTSFTFTGTGFQLYGNSNSASGVVTVYSLGNLNKLYMIDTKLSAGTSGATNQQSSGTYYSLPFISETDLPYGTYTVQIKQTNNQGSIYLDGVRVFNTINEENKTAEDSIYRADLEDKPDFYEVRDFVLNAIDVEKLEDSQYTDPADRVGLVDKVSDMAGQVYNTIAANSASAVIVDKSESFTATDVKDLLDNGPKNELYLYKDQTLVFNVKTPRVVQLGLKAPTGSASFNLTVNGTKQDLSSLSTSVDMFYDIAAQNAATNGYTVTITNTGSNVLSVTLLKICDDPNATFPALTQEDIENTLLGIYGLTDVDVPVEPEVPEETIKPTEPEVEETTKPSKPNKPSKPEKPGKPENTKPTEPQKPGKPGNNGNQKPGKPGKNDKDEEKTYTLKITFVNLFGKKVGTATITTTNGMVSASQIAGKAPARYKALWFIPVTLRANGNTSIVVPVL